MAASTADIAYALDSVVGPSPGALDSRPKPRLSWSMALQDAGLPVRVIWSPTLGYAPVDSEVRSVCERAIDRLGEHGCQCIQVDEVFDADPVRTWITLVDAYLARTVMEAGGGVLLDDLEEQLGRMVEHGLTLSALEFVAALDECYRLQQRLSAALRQAPILLTPATASAAPLSGQPGTINGVPDIGWVRFTYPFNLTRSPSGTVCAGKTAAGLPVGLQVVGLAGADLEVLRTMEALERVVGLVPLRP